ncbi:hypothetical protein CU669_14190 [Paramagnetospirillum kuznetsovii]|uniref:Uncharacterized protein n=1 Tax=Paramagnetospirillum kuznetsovii TaxID=2053833 RepID=A0A364NW85_9PROT|nr:hypothetical protein [Paramagnetospirillum kuznetsovii]RAU21316.1 hypothetical protein CU669_14190 [Paramagnetospirillum kuznetsovii]
MKPVSDIVALPSITGLLTGHDGMVVVAGSHGGVLAARIAAANTIRAVILNDAGIGLDRAGIAGLTVLESVGMAAAAVDYRSARIGDGAHMLARGVISHVNALAQALGVETGMPTAEAAWRLRAAALPAQRHARPESRPLLLSRLPRRPDVWGMDSASDISSALDGAIVVTGSHGGLPGGDPKAALRCAARAVLFNDAGIGMDEAGVGRLAVLATQGIAAAVVDAMTARIGDARSTWETGIVSRVNATAKESGAAPGMSARDFSALFR